MSKAEEKKSRVMVEKERQENEEFGEFLSIAKDVLGFNDEDFRHFIGYPEMKYVKVMDGSRPATNKDFLEGYLKNVMKEYQKSVRVNGNGEGVLHKYHIGEDIKRRNAKRESTVKIGIRYEMLDPQVEAYLVEENNEPNRYDWEEELIHAPNRREKIEDTILMGYGKFEDFKERLTV